MKHERLLICTDLDRTLIPNGPQPESPEARERFALLAEHPYVSLAYVSGRHRALVEQAIADYRLPLPDYVIGDVGTTIYCVGPEHLWQHEQAWDDAIAVDWGAQDHAGLSSMLSDLTLLQLQEESKQNRFKLSYYLPLMADIAGLGSVIGRRLNESGVRARLIWSVDEAAATGLLDILPERASKFHAIQALIDNHGFGLEQTVFCGDSGNDLEVLVSAIPSVLVANSSEEVQSQAIRQASDNGHADRLYVALGGFMGMNGNYAGGMLEGIVHYHPEAAAWLQTDASEETLG